jgi:acetyl/propionyl-CoA carboxylase alpha subunit
MSEINKIVVANRGEIALRIMRTAREMGIKTVAVFSEADRKAPHTLYADEAYYIGLSPSKDSYLLGDKIIEVAKLSAADAIHPGYGFLSENAEFSESVTNAGLIFIGPSGESIRTMGDKISAKQTVEKYDIPLVPGVARAVEDKTEAKQIAEKVGYPVLIKASAGGGGKGMRVVENREEFDEQMNRAVSEAVQAFGNGAVFIEKFITKPKHIEIQIIADTHGNVVHLFERECSVQRRHQKVVEEAPSSCLTSEIREVMGKCAVQVAKSCNYHGAGTVEFIVDEKLDFYFLEMNTRLQVEHPVTELITGIDIVKEMIHIAEGKLLSVKQEDLKIIGHAIEVRICAEDPENNFLPDGIEEGMTIPIFYDPMIGKLIAHGKDRNEAIQKLTRAIDEFQIAGIKTTLSFGKFVINHPAFQSGKFDTRFVSLYFKPDEEKKSVDSDNEKIAVMLSNQLLISSSRKSTNENPTVIKLDWIKNRKRI